MLRPLFTLFILVGIYSARAQSVLDISKNDFYNVAGNFFYTINGEAVPTVKYVKVVEGTPYFSDEWMKAIVILNNGDRCKNVTAKLDLLDNSLLFKNDKGAELIATMPLQEIVFMSTMQDSLYRLVHSSAFKETTNVPQGWYHWLHTGKASLYKYIKKDLSENKPYGSATTEQRINTKEKYFVFFNNTLFEVKNMKALPAVLANKKEELQAYIKTLPEKLSFDDKLTAALVYYNSLLF